ncbi:MAG: hypothetical protein SNJ59_12740 [Aggregatilineales bacterium]
MPRDQRVLRAAAGLLFLLLAACNLSVPQATPTVAPTRTPSQTPFFTATATAWPTFTPTFTASPTLTPSPTPTLPPTETPSGTPTETPTGTPSPTLTSTASETPTGTPSPTLTSTPSETPTGTPSPTLTSTPSETPTGTPSPTLTSTPSETPTGTPSPTLTPLPTIGPTVTPAPTLTPSPTVTVEPLTPVQPLGLPPTPDERAIAFAATLTAIAGAATAQAEATALAQTQIAELPTLVPIELPTIDATPTFITAAPGTLPAVEVTLPPEAFQTPADFGPAAPTPIPSPEPLLQPTAIIPRMIAPTAPPEIFALPPETRAFTLTTAGGLSGALIEAPGGIAVRFAQHPLNPFRFAVIDPIGLLYQVRDTRVGGRERFEASPFSAFTPGTPEENSAYVTQVAWSPDGTMLAFLVDSLAAERDGRRPPALNDGLWLMYFDGERQAGPAVHLFRACPYEGAPVCDLVDRTAGPYQYRARAFRWNAQSSGLLVELDLFEDPIYPRAVVPLAVTSAQAAGSSLRDVFRYDGATWSPDGRSLLLHGNGEDRRVGVRRLPFPVPDPPLAALLIDAAAVGLASVAGAVERADGSLLLIGSPLGPDSAQALYRASATQVTPIGGPIGMAPPSRIDWSPDRSAALVVTPGIVEGAPIRYFVASEDGRVEEITLAVAGALAVEWSQ